MKAKLKSNRLDSFKPVKITLTIETLDEARALNGRLGLTQHFINKQWDTNSCLGKNPDCIAPTSTSLEPLELLIEEIITLND